MDLVVDGLLADALEEVAERQRLAAVAEEPLRVELAEALARLAHQEALELGQVLGRHQAIAVDPVGLVDPAVREDLGLLELGGRRHQQPLEDAGHVADVELVVEVRGRLPELLHDLSM